MACTLKIRERGITTTTKVEIVVLECNTQSSNLYRYQISSNIAKGVSAMMHTRFCLKFNE